MKAGYGAVLALLAAAFLAVAQNPDSPWKTTRSSHKTTYEYGDCKVTVHHKQGSLETYAFDPASSLGPLSQSSMIERRSGKTVVTTFSKYYIRSAEAEDQRGLEVEVVLPLGFTSELFRAYCAEAAQRLPAEVRRLFRGIYDLI